MRSSSLLFNPNQQAWQGLNRLPWHDAAFSERMLREHLSQAHDQASRRFEIIDRHVQHLAELFRTLAAQKILDLGCGPGFYSERLTKIGFDCYGIDISPAAIHYAKNQARAQDLNCTYKQADLLEGHYGTGFDAAFFIFGELNAFSPKDALSILKAAFIALKPTGVLVLEVHTQDFVKSLVKPLKTWSRSSMGLFSDAPYLLLHESYWDDEQEAVIEYFHVLRESETQLETYVTSLQSYSQKAYEVLLAEAGFTRLEFLAALDGQSTAEAGLFELRAYKS